MYITDKKFKREQINAEMFWRFI